VETTIQISAPNQSNPGLSIKDSVSEMSPAGRKRIGKKKAAEQKDLLTGTVWEKRKRKVT